MKARHILRAVILASALAFGNRNAGAYTLEGPAWPTGSVVIFQLNLGNPNGNLQDGSSSWNDAVAPALDMWNQNIQRIHTAGVPNSLVSASSGDGLNTVVFSNSIF